MNIQKYPKEEIALQQIETALALFTRQGELFSVITLAGAAEEILGQLLQQKSEHGLLELFSTVLEVLRPASRKEQKSGGLSSHETDLYVHMDVHQEAVFLLGRAIDDYLTLTGTITPAMLKFNNEVRLKTS
jgi:hypothetical protein